MKVYERDSAQGQRELDVYRHLNSMTTAHVGCTLVRTAHDNFHIRTSKGNHLCLIHAPLGMSLAGLRARAAGKKLSEELLKLTLIHIFHALDFLHSEAKVVHTGVALYLFLNLLAYLLTRHFRYPREKHIARS
jgi:serine/threonine-protein kinase SRPK3